MAELAIKPELEVTEMSEDKKYPSLDFSTMKV